MHDPRQDAVQVESLEQADSGRVQGVQLAVPCVQRLEVARCAQRHRRLVGEGPERLKALARRQHRVGGVVGPDEPAARAVSFDQRHEQPVIRPRARTRPTAPGLVARAIADESRRDGVFDQIAPFDLELRHEQQIQVGVRQAEVEPGIIRLPAGRTRRREVAAVRKADGDLLELERLLDSARDVLEHRVDGFDVDQRGGEVEQAAQRCAVTGGLGGDLDPLVRHDHMLGEGDEHVDLLIRRPQARPGFVDGHDTEQRPVGAAHRDDEGVLRVPGIGIQADREIRNVRGHSGPDGFVVRNEVGAAPEEALGQKRRPPIRRSGRAEQRVARLLVPVHRRHFEVAFSGPVEVDRDRAPAERLRDRLRNPVDEPRQIALVADKTSDLEQAPQLRER